MLRWMVPALAAMLTVSAAVAADLPATPKRRAAAPPQEPPQVYVDTDPDALISDNRAIMAEFPWTPRFADLDQIVTHALAWERKLTEIRGE